MVSLQKPFGAGVTTSVYNSRFGNQPGYSFGDMIKTLSWYKEDPFIGFFGFWTLRDPQGYQPSNVDRAVEDYKERMNLLDNCVGVLIQKFKEYKLFDNTIIVFVADHGEYFSGFERQYSGTFIKGHNHSRYEEVINIPCLIYIPGIDCRFFDCTLEIVDITPTLLGLCKVDKQSTEFDGKDFSEEILGNISVHKKHVVIGRTANANYLTIRSTDDGYKLLLDNEQGYRLFNFKKDSAEQINYALDNSEIVESLKKIAESNVPANVSFTKDDYIDRFIGYKNIEYVKKVFDDSKIEDCFESRKNYGKGNWVNDKNSIEELFSYSEKDKGKLLDIGSGDGVVAKAGCDKGFDAYAVDLSPAMLLKINDNRVRTIFGRVEKTSFDDLFFDLVIARGLFQYVENLEKGFKEIHRITKRKGVFILFNTVSPSDDLFEEWSSLHKILGSRRILRKSLDYVNTISKYFVDVEYKNVVIKQSVANWAESNNLEINNTLNIHRNLSDSYKTSCNFLDNKNDIIVDLSFILLRAKNK